MNESKSVCACVCVFDRQIIFAQEKKGYSNLEEQNLAAGPGVYMTLLTQRLVKSKAGSFMVLNID